MVAKHLTGVKRYPLVLMLEPLFRCNLACAGCGKIDYPDEILNQRLSYEQCMESIDECGAPAVVIAGGEPLLHRDLPRIVQGCIERKKFDHPLHQRSLAQEEDRQVQAEAPSSPGPSTSTAIRPCTTSPSARTACLDKAVEAIKLAKSKGFRTQINCTLFEGSEPERVAAFFDEMKTLGLDGVTLSPGYAYERAPDQEHFLNRQKTKSFFREMFARRQRQEVGVHPVRPVPGLPGRQPDLSNAPRGPCRCAPCSAGRSPATSSAKAMCQDLQGVDGGHQVGRLRRRQL